MTEAAALCDFFLFLCTVYKFSYLLIYKQGYSLGLETFLYFSVSSRSHLGLGL